MVRRISEGVVVGVIAAGVVKMLDDPAGPRGFIGRLVAAIGGLSPSLSSSLFVVALISGALGVGLMVRGWRVRDLAGNSFWEFELHMPSWPTTVLGLSGVVALAWTGVLFCGHGSFWGLVPLSIAGWTVLRFAIRLHERWQSTFGML